MCNTSAFAQNLRVTRIHQCMWSMEFIEVLTQSCPFFANFKLLWSTFPSRTCFPCKASCFNNLFVCTCCSWFFFIQDADVEWFSSAYIRQICNTILIASYWNIVVHTWRWKDAHNSSWTEFPSNEEPCDHWMIGHALLFFVAASKEPTEAVLTTASQLTFGQARFRYSLRRSRQESRESRAHGVVSKMTAFQLPLRCQGSVKESSPFEVRDKNRENQAALHGVHQTCNLEICVMGGLERLVRYLSSAAHFNLQTCCSFWSLTWLCWGFPANQSASEFPVRSLDSKILHDLQNRKEEHCFWMKGEIGCTWWSDLHSVRHFENIATPERFWRGPSISTQMTLIATQSNNWSIYRVYALMVLMVAYGVKILDTVFLPKSGLNVFSWMKAAELLLDSWRQCAGLNTSGITEKANKRWVEDEFMINSNMFLFQSLELKYIIAMVDFFCLQTNP